MILDGQNTFSDLASGDSPTLVQDTASANTIDQMAGAGAIGSRYAGAYVAPWVIARVSVAGVSGGGGSIQAVLQDSANNSGWTDQVLGPVTAAAAATAGAILLAQRILPSMRRYLRIAWRITTAVFSAGTFMAFLTLDQDVIDLSLRAVGATFSQSGQLSEAVGNGVLDS